ncbi:hypothetical protein GY12_16510 [Micrococcus luteus]|nr:hypothetical protein GY12_16510 [Micrococcus luteus]
MSSTTASNRSPVQREVDGGQARVRDHGDEVRARRQGQLGEHEGHELPVQVDHRLLRAGSGRLEIARQGQRARAEVQDPHRRAGGGGHVEHVGHAAQVLVADARGVGQVHVGLDGPADLQDEPAELVGGDAGVHARRGQVDGAAGGGRLGGHAPSIPPLSTLDG